MELTKLTAISPVDGRYRDKVNELAIYFSEYGLIRYRVVVEIEYFIQLCKIPLPGLADFPKDSFVDLRELYEEFDEQSARSVKEYEKTTNHDVKAIEYWIKSRFDDLSLSKYKEYIHFGLTSQDINNTAVPLSVKDALTNEFYPQIDSILDELNHFSRLWKDIPMLARTHGQPASPTTIGKEIKVFESRIASQLALLKMIPFSAKFGGATGNMNAHVVTYPDVDWNRFAESFVNETLQLHRSFPTTQIEHYDNLAALFDALKRINTILIDLCRDVWQYISLNYFTQKIQENEVGSSAMPHKVNPIDFENAEGNLGIANALAEHMAAKLPISRLQRDLTDSTVTRNIGLVFAHMHIALKSLAKGLTKIELNKDSLDADLEDNWAVVAEAIQNILRSENYPEPYEALKALTRTNEKITQETIHKFVEGLGISKELKDRLKKVTPYNYVGLKLS